jgi:hypothetical protein
MVFAVLSYTPARWYQVPVVGARPLTATNDEAVESEFRWEKTKTPPFSCR